MKRWQIATLIIAALVSGIVISLHISAVALRLEFAATDFLGRQGSVAHVVSEKWQYLFVFLVSAGVAAAMITARDPRRIFWLVGGLILELAAVSFVCSLQHTFFQPLPTMLAAAFAAALAYAFLNFSSRPRATVSTGIFTGRLSIDQLARIKQGNIAVETGAKAYEATAVVCDIGNKHALAEECDADALAEITQRFIEKARQSLLDAGAYIESAAGEGVVAIFGFPSSDDEQAETATKACMNLLRLFSDLRKDGDSEVFRKFDVHLGVSSGTMIFAPLKADDGVHLLGTGEPVELARRFCIANRFYGSEILIGPRTFELANKTIVARPIDFLSGVDVRERHEIYQPISLASDATPDEIARRDSFWNGVVLFREKRWAEAYAHFQKARASEDALDPPLQLYLRRLEPLALQLLTSAFEQ